MSSWIIAKARQQKKPREITMYHDTSSSRDILSMYLHYLAAFIYCQKIGETCNVWDTTGLIKDSLKLTPQVRLLKEQPQINPIANTEMNEILSKLTFKDIQKVASGLLVYDDSLNNSIIKALDKFGIKGKNIFDIGIHLDSGTPTDTSITRLVELIRAFQVKSKKDKLNIYVMSDTYNKVIEFQKLCDASWKITSLSKNVPRGSDETFIQILADIQIMSGLTALILDFNKPADKFIYLMQKGKMDYFVEISSSDWKIL